jgi:hypothetical protein
MNRWIIFFLIVSLLIVGCVDQKQIYTAGECLNVAKLATEQNSANVATAKTIQDENEVGKKYTIAGTINAVQNCYCPKGAECSICFQNIEVDDGYGPFVINTQKASCFEEQKTYLLQIQITEITPELIRAELVN